jgi:hypothetical protein
MEFRDHFACFKNLEEETRYRFDFLHHCMNNCEELTKECEVKSNAIS